MGFPPESRRGLNHAAPKRNRDRRGACASSAAFPGACSESGMRAGTQRRTLPRSGAQLFSQRPPPGEVARAIPRRLRASHDGTVKKQGSRTPGTGSLLSLDASRPAPRAVLRAACSPSRRPVRHRSSVAPFGAPMQPHCARLVVAGRRRDRDGQRKPFGTRTVKRRSGRPSHGPPCPRRGTASPPPTGTGDYGGSLGEGECGHTRIKGNPVSRTIVLFGSGATGIVQVR